MGVRRIDTPNQKGGLPCIFRFFIVGQNPESTPSEMDKTLRRVEKPEIPAAAFERRLYSQAREGQAGRDKAERILAEKDGRDACRAGVHMGCVTPQEKGWVSFGFTLNAQGHPPKRTHPSVSVLKSGHEGLYRGAIASKTKLGAKDAKLIGPQHDSILALPSCPETSLRGRLRHLPPTGGAPRHVIWTHRLELRIQVGAIGGSGVVLSLLSKGREHCYYWAIMSCGASPDVEH